AVAADFGDCQALHPERLQRFLDVVELERLDDRGDELHADAPSVRLTVWCEARWPGENPPAATPPKPYAVSACSTVSMPSCSSSGVRRRPITQSMPWPRMTDATNETPP